LGEIMVAVMGDIAADRTAGRTCHSPNSRLCEP
jgi:hypothetical protein